MAQDLSVGVLTSLSQLCTLLRALADLLAMNFRIFIFEVSFVMKNAQIKSI